MQFTVMTFAFPSLPFSPFPLVLMRTSSHFSFMPFMFSAHPFIMLLPPFTLMPIPFIPTPIMTIVAVKLYYSLRVIVI
jgi:hypothetical protein